jgi:hypothetical protein
MNSARVLLVVATVVASTCGGCGSRAGSGDGEHVVAAIAEIARTKDAARLSDMLSHDTKRELSRGNAVDAAGNSLPFATFVVERLHSQLPLKLVSEEGVGENERSIVFEGQEVVGKVRYRVEADGSVKLDLHEPAKAWRDLTDWTKKVFGDEGKPVAPDGAPILPIPGILPKGASPEDVMNSFTTIPGMTESKADVGKGGGSQTGKLGGSASGTED